jgi:signal transduction histidine kinase
MSAVLPRARRPRLSRRGVRRLEPSEGSSTVMRESVAIMIHDLRAPLAVIAASAELLNGSVIQQGSTEDAILLQRIQRNASWLATLVDHLAAELALSTEERTSSASAVDLPECLDTALAITQSLFDQRQQRVHWTRAGEFLVHGDRRQIEQVLVNLLTNASKYGSQQSEIRIDVEAAGEFVRTQIHNDGPPIQAGEHEQIFERFTRGSNAHSASAAGLGLGLHIVKTIVERYGGQVGVISSSEQGTALWFTLRSVYSVDGGRASGMI